MTNKRRLTADQRDLQLAEGAYKERLQSALRKCAAGSWGLFGANDAVKATLSNRLAATDPAWTELSERHDEIAALRASLGLGPFLLHQRLLKYRSEAIDPNAPGEPRLAQRFLNELTDDAAMRKRISDRNHS